MTKRLIVAIASLGFGLALATGCSKGGKESEPPTPAPPTGETPQPGPTERPQLTNAECEAQGGTIVGDIGDGAIHRPDYLCANGKPPLGSIRAEQGEPIAVEGSVCCPGGAS